MEKNYITQTDNKEAEHPSEEGGVPRELPPLSTIDDDETQQEHLKEEIKGDTNPEINGEGKQTGNEVDSVEVEPKKEVLTNRKLESEAKIISVQNGATTKEDSIINSTEGISEIPKEKEDQSKDPISSVRKRPTTGKDPVSTNKVTPQRKEIQFEKTVNTTHVPTRSTTKKRDLGKDSITGGNTLIGLLILVAVFVVVFVVGFYYFSPLRNHNYNSIVIFTDKLKKMQKDFPNQYELIWNMFKNGGHRHLKKVHSGNNEKLTPLSYLVAGYAGSSKTVDCFVSRLNDAYTSDSVQVLYSQNFSRENDKGRLVNEITSRLNGTKKFLVVKDIEKLPFKVAQLFMSYADEHNQVASYPQSILILTTELPFSYDPTQSRHLDEGKVGKHFKTDVWHGIHPDKAAPLWSRVGDGLGLIRKEEICPCEE